MLKRAVAVILALVMIIGLLPILPASITALAANSGKCGASITWSLSGDTLTVTGYGDMYDYNLSNSAPWKSQSASIKKVAFNNSGSGITSIGAFAFSECSNLTDVTLPSTLRTVGTRAFNECVKLKNISLPESVATIGDYAFYSCLALPRVPSDSGMKNVTSLGTGAFMRCTAIKEPVFPPQLTSVPQCLYAFCTGLNVVVFPENVTKIGSSAFQGCSSLLIVALNTGVVEVGGLAFKGCTKLKKVYISNPLTMWSSAFDECSTTTDFNIGISESEFTSNSRIESYNDSFNKAKHTYGKNYLVIQNPNGGAGSWFGSAGVPRLFDYSVGKSFTLSSAASDLPTKEGFSFFGWNTKPDGSGTTYMPGDEYTDNVTINLYARWGYDITRLSGSSRNGTAVAISQDLFSDNSAVVLANGWDFADALAGGSLAYTLDAPILLITGNESDEETFAEIERLKAKKVYILGGTGAVSAEVETKLKNDGCEVERIAGDNRFETAVKIAEKIDDFYDGETSSSAFFAYSHNYPDALAVSGIAASKDAPILYIGSDGVLDPATEAYVQHCDFPNTYILGGTGAIKAAAEGNIKKAGAKDVERIAGSTRYETCLEIIKAFPDNVDNGSVCVATGVNFPDALAGSVLAAYYEAPMMLVAPDEPLSAAQKECFLNHFDNSLGNVYILGGKVAVPEAIENELRYLFS